MAAKKVTASDIPTLIKDIKDVATKILKKDVSTLRGFSERQVTAIAQHAVLIQKGIITKDITEETLDFFLDGIEDMALNFVSTLRGLIAVTIEKVWNGIVKVIWEAIEKTTGIVISEA